MIILKSERDLEAMRPACTVARMVLDEVCDFIQPGRTTQEINQYAASRIKQYGARSAFLGYQLGIHAPGRRDPRLALAAAHTLLLAHGRAVEVLRSNVPRARIGITLNPTHVEAASLSAQAFPALVMPDNRRPHYTCTRAG